VLEAEDGAVQGQSVGLKGKIRGGATDSAPAAGEAAVMEWDKLPRRVIPFALALGIWFIPVPGGLTAQAWHLFALFFASIAAVLVGAFPLVTSTMLAVAAVVLTGTLEPAKAFSASPMPACCW